ncbi:MAG: hypothetical protein K6C13_12540 [Oscillospiraceae bacterium]|nr:hypothetical protein [Oscillospiraceae bacterium]
MTINLKKEKNYSSAVNEKYTDTSSGDHGTTRDIEGLFQQSLHNYFTVERYGEKLFSIPVFAVIILLIMLIHLLIPFAILLFVGMMFGYSYSLEGDQLRNSKINDFFGWAYEKAQSVKGMI